jgi:methyl-accepting chemotaxis protein
MNLASTILKLSASVALLALAGSAVSVADSVWHVSVSLQKTGVVLCNTISVIPGRLDAVISEVNKANEILGTSSATLLSQTSEVQRNLSQTLAGVDSTTAQLKANLTQLGSMEDSITKVVSNPDIPALVRDARQTVALTGSTMSHVRTTANVIAEQAPAVGASTVRIADNVAGVTADVHKITTDFTKPKPWWKVTLSYLGDGAKIGGALF